MIYISTTFASDQSSVLDVLKLCKHNGIKNLELGSNHSNELDVEQGVQQYDFCYLVHNYFPIPKEPFVINIASADDEIYQRSVNHIFNAINFCQQIGSGLYTFHPGFLTDPDGANKDASNYDFQFEDSYLKGKTYEEAYDRMVEAVSHIVPYAKARGIRIAIETEGSVLKKDHLLMQRPGEYERFFRDFSTDDIGINLNIGHLRLASSAFGFEIQKFVDLVADYVVAMELSHNNGLEDEHLPLIEGEWYWKTICDPRFDQVYKILEFRNVNIDTILSNIEMCQRYLG